MRDTMRLADLLHDYTPGDGHSWAEEMKWIEGNHTGNLALLVLNIIAYGIKEPILLGDDGRVWDGHHRITVAHKIGIEKVPVTYAKDQEDQ